MTAANLFDVVCNDHADHACFARGLSEADAKQTARVARLKGYRDVSVVPSVPAEGTTGPGAVVPPSVETVITVEMVRARVEAAEMAVRREAADYIDRELEKARVRDNANLAEIARLRAALAAAERANTEPAEGGDAA